MAEPAALDASLTLAGGTSTSLDGGAMTKGSLSGGVILSETQLGNMALRAKKERKRAEDDRELLRNRINRLLIEKERANKRIAETRRRTAEIEKLQQRNARAAAAREDATAWLDSEQSLQKELMQQERAHREAAIANSRTTMYSLRKDEVSVLKKMREENEKAVQAQRELEHQRAKERKEMVLNSQKAAQARKEEEQKRALEDIKKKRDQKREELDDDALSHLEAYSSLAEEERRLIASLQKWQSVQDDAFTQLDGVMTGSKRGSRPTSRQPVVEAGPTGAIPMSAEA